MVEKTEFIGGSTAMSGGGVWIPNNPLMRSYGIADSEDDALAHFEAVVGDIGLASSPERRRAFVANGPRLVEFLQQRGVPFRYADGYSDYYPDAPGGKEHGRTIEAYPFDAHELGPWEKKLRPGMSTGLGLVGFGTELTAISYYNRSARCFATGARVLGRTLAGRARARAMVANGGALVGRLLRSALEQGTEIWTESPIEELIVQDGAVVGAVILRRGKALRVAARLGVLLAAGGFSRNSEMRDRYGGGQARSAKWSISNPGDTGEVLEMAMSVGGATGLLDEAFWLPMPCMADGSLPRYPSRQVSAFSSPLAAGVDHGRFDGASLRQ